MREMRRIGEELVAGYRFVAYCFLPGWFAIWANEKGDTLDGAPWWTGPLATLIAALALVCTLRIEMKPSGAPPEGVE